MVSLLHPIRDKQLLPLSVPTAKLEATMQLRTLPCKKGVTIEIMQIPDSRDAPVAMEVMTLSLYLRHGSINPCHNLTNPNNTCRRPFTYAANENTGLKNCKRTEAFMIKASRKGYALHISHDSGCDT